MRSPDGAKPSVGTAFIVSFGVALVMILIGPGTASAHPLGNFSVNHLDQIRFEPTRVVVDSIVDIAEIPTTQATPRIDTDGDGVVSAAEADEYAAVECDDLQRAFTLAIDGVPSPLTVNTVSYEQRDGVAGLLTGRLECGFETSADLRTERTVTFTDDYQTQRVGWREIVAVADGVGLVDPPVPTSSVTNGLTAYPVELLKNPSNVRTATFDVTPVVEDGGAGEAVRSVPLSEPGPFSAVVDRVSRRFNDLVGRDDLTVSVGVLAVALALLLGASHALLPGHGKTVMAAYIAGRQGSVRDAVLVGATVTGTHTGGVLILGLALTISSSLAGESVIGWLGVVSGLLIAGLGAALLVGAIRHRPSLLDAHGHTHGPGGHTHGPGGHTHGPGGHSHDPVRTPHARAHDHDILDAPAGTVILAPPAHDDNDHDHDHAPQQFSRRGLVGMGVAGGLVPSPSALVILLSAIALGRTAFGIVLVLAYGVGMAGTLTLAGVMLVKLRDRFQDRASNASDRARSVAAKWGRIMPYATALLVLVVGLGLTIRGLASV